MKMLIKVFQIKTAYKHSINSCLISFRIILNRIKSQGVEIYYILLVQNAGITKIISNWGSHCHYIDYNPQMDARETSCVENE